MANIAVLGLQVDSSGAIVATENLGRALNRLGESAVKSEDKLEKMVTRLATIGVSAAGLLKAVTDAAAFEKQMALIATVTDTTTVSMKALEMNVLRTFKSLPVGSINELTKGLYDIISAGFPAAEAVGLLDVSAKAAIAGITSTATAVDGLTTVLAAFKGQGLTAAQASDSLFQAVNVGKITFEQLAGSIGKVAPVAAAYNIKLNDVLAATAQLTVNGLSAEESFTSIRSAISNIIKPTDDYIKRFPALAKEFNATKLQAVGFTEFLKQFNTATGGSKDALNALFTDIQGKVGVLSLLSDGGQGVTDKLQGLEKATGAADKAFNTINQTSAQTFQLLKNQLTAGVIELGTKALPLVNSGLGLFSKVLTFVKGNLPAVAGLVTAVGVGFLAWSQAARVAALYTSLLGAVQTIQAFVSLALTVRKIADAMALLSLVGKGAVGAVAAVAALAAGLLVYRAAANAIEKDTANAAKELEKFQKLAEENLGNPTAPTIPGVDQPTGPVDLGPTQDQIDAAKALRDSNADRVRLAQQALALEGLVGDEYEKQVILNKARNQLLTESRDLTTQELRDELALSIEQEKQLALETLAVKRAKELTNANKERMMAAADNALFAQLEGQALADAQAEQRAALAIMEAKRTLTGQELQDRLTAIEYEYEQAVAANEVNAVLEARKAKQDELNEKAKKYLDEQKQSAENFERQFLQTVSSGIEGILKNGTQGFKSFVKSVQDLFLKMFADILAANVFKKLTNAMGALIPGSAMKMNNVANANFGLQPTFGQQAFAGAGIGAAGFGVGFGVGSLTTNKGLGAAGGALSGAATGAALGSVVPGIGTLVGGVIGGAAGFIGGLLGSSKKAKEAAEKMREAQKQVDQQLQALRDSFSNDRLGTAIKQAQDQFKQLREGIEQAFSGKKNEQERNKRLAELNVLEAQRLQQIRQEFADRQRQVQEDLRIRELRAQGLDEEADKLAFGVQQQREYAAAVKEGADAVSLAALNQTQAAEAARFAAEQQKRAAQAAEESRRRIADLEISTQALTNPRDAERARAIEDANNRIFDAIARGASEAELAAIALYNAAVLAKREAEQAEQDRRTTESLVGRGLSAAGNTRGAEDANLASSQRQELVDAIQSGFSPTNLALLQFVQFAERAALETKRAIEDGTKAIQDSAKAQIADLNVLIEVTRSGAQAQIKAIDAQIAAINTQTAATLKGFDNQIAAVKEQTKQRLENIDAQITAAKQSVELQKAQLQKLDQTVSLNRQVVENLRDFSQSLLLSDVSPLSPEEQLRVAREQFDALATAAQSGDAVAAGKLPDAAQKLLEASRSFNATSPAFVQDFNRVQQVLSAVEATFGEDLPVQEQQLEALRKQVESSERSIEALNAQKEAIQAECERQIAKLEEAKVQAKESADRLIEALEKQKEKISADAEATIAKLEEQRKAIEAAAQKQIDQLIADENAKLQTRLRENQFYDLFQQYAKDAGTFFTNAIAAQEQTGNGLGGNGADGVGTGPSTGTGAPGAPPVQVALESMVVELKEANRILKEELTEVKERLGRLLSVSVEATEQEVRATQRVESAVYSVQSAVREQTQVNTVRNRPVGLV